MLEFMRYQLSLGGLTHIRYLLARCMISRSIDIGCRSSLHLICGVKPLFTHSIVPETASLHARRKNVLAFAMLLAILPHTVVLATIGPCVDTKAALFVIQVVTLVHSAVLPCVNTVSMHVIVEPFAHVHSAIWPYVLARPADLIL